MAPPRGGRCDRESSGMPRGAGTSDDTRPVGLASLKIRPLDFVAGHWHDVRGQTGRSHAMSVIWGLTMTLAATRVTKLEAARILGVSERTVNRKIAAGELETERETTGRRRVMVLLDAEMHASAATDQSEEVIVLRERVAGLEDLVEYLHEQLDFERSRYAGLYHDIKTGALALPAPKADRPWWRFWAP